MHNMFSWHAGHSEWSDIRVSIHLCCTTLCPYGLHRSCGFHKGILQWSPHPYPIPAHTISNMVVFSIITTEFACWNNGAPIPYTDFLNLQFEMRIWHVLDINSSINSSNWMNRLMSSTKHELQLNSYQKLNCIQTAIDRIWLDRFNMRQSAH